MKFLNGFDVVYVNEAPGFKSIHHGISFISEIESKENSAEILLNYIRKNFKTRIWNNENYAKVFYTRQVCDGFYYWSKNNSLTVDDYVRFFDSSYHGEDGQSEEDFRKYFNDIIENPLPANDTANLEILVGKHRVRSNGRLVFPVSVF